MKQTIKIIVLGLLLSISAVAVSARTIQLRVMTMNIKECGQYDGYKTSGFAECIRTYNPDVIALQEVDYFTTRNGGKDWLTELAQSLGMQPYYGKSFDYQGGAFGVALLSKYPFYMARTVVSTPAGAREPRACAWIYVSLPDGQTVRVASAHLAVESVQMQIQNLADIHSVLFLDDTTPSLIMGDFNASPDSNTLDYARLRWQDIGAGTGFTIPSSGPTTRIDYIMGYPKKWSQTSYQIVAYPNLSDHCFVVADVKYTD